MPRKISANVDMQILADIGLGMMNKDIAVRHGVSASYVSKLRVGKKKVDIYIPEQPKTVADTVAVSDSEVDAVIELIEGQTNLMSHAETVAYLEDQARKSVVRAKMYLNILKKYKGE